jgi:hypothetical protein
MRCDTGFDTRHCIFKDETFGSFRPLSLGARMGGADIAS